MLNVGFFVFFFIQTYITSVLWSDQNEIVVYRSFLDFKKMHVSKDVHYKATATFHWLSVKYILKSLTYRHHYSTETNEESVPDKFFE